MTPEEYKEEQKKRMSLYIVGNKDKNGNIIQRIYGRGDEYILYEIASSDINDAIKVWIDTKTETDSTGIIKKYNETRAKFVEVKGCLYKVVDKMSIKNRIAQILIHGMITSSDEANKQFDDLIHEIQKEYRDQFANRMRFVLSSLMVSLVLISFSIAGYHYQIGKGEDHLYNLIFVCAGGSVGGFFSITIGVNKLICEKDVEHWLYILYGFERISIAILAAVITYFAIRADLAFGICEKLKHPVVGYTIFAVAAGFSETLVPNLLTKLESKK
jgi:hypothetical protein